jgi:hypothetical protein
VRKNPDSPRVHGLHIGVDSFSVQSQAAVENSSGNEAFPRVVPVVERVKQSFTEPPNARTTGSRDLMHLVGFPIPVRNIQALEFHATLENEWYVFWLNLHPALVERSVYDLVLGGAIGFESLWSSSRRLFQGWPAIRSR